jgi:hypothetical protein
MKGMFDDSKTFEAYAAIDYCYFMIKEWANCRTSTFDEIKTATISIVKDIIRYKKQIGADWTNVFLPFCSSSSYVV